MAQTNKRIFSTPANKVKNESGKDELILSPHLPLPNIVRIEVLSAAARNRYLGTTQQFGSNLKDVTAQAFRKKGLDKFYGFMRNGVKKGFTMNSDWSNTGTNLSGIIGGLRSLVGGGGFDVKGGAAQFAGLARDLTGISAVSTGSSSLKRFNNTDLKDFEVECGWYLPEQFKICNKSIKTILRMVYPIQTPEISEKILTDVISNGLNATVNAVKDVATDLVDVAVPPSDDNTDNLAKPTELSKSDKNSIIEKAATFTGSVASKIITGAQKTAGVFGLNLTFDPSPVRCSIGQYMDIEPLVISSVNIQFSDETFVNTDGRHLPIFCVMKIGFKFWLNPAPNSEFMNIMGEEVFGG